MAKKKKAAATTVSENLKSQQTPTTVPKAPSTSTTSNGTKAAASATSQSTPSSLCISRNKHWRYISAFHGPWLQLPHEILTTLIQANALSPPPFQTHPGVLFDLLKIRHLVDEASDLAVRAQNGTASSALAQGADNGLPGGALGLSYKGGGGGNAKLSPERKFRMRELAVAKLSQAYRLDEVAASVATMQSTSALDALGSLVLQRSPNSTDAAYVHFFHERIPSRMMAECTSLDPLDRIIAHEPGHAAPLRTRALTKVFKEDYLGAIRDLTEALALCRSEAGKKHQRNTQLVVKGSESDQRRMYARDWVNEHKIAEEDQPTGMEMQVLFQRGNLHLTVACQYIRRALEDFRTAQRIADQAKSDGEDCRPEGEEAPPVKSAEEMEAYRRGLEAREVVRRNAKKALRDFTAFFAQLDYAWGDFESEQTNGHAEKSNGMNGRAQQDQKLLENGTATEDVPNALTSHTPNGNNDRSRSRRRDDRPPPPDPIIYDIATVLSSSPPSDLPAFPATPSTALALRTSTSNTSAPQTPPLIEITTYHPLLPEALHAFLLTHSLLQTPPRTVHRLANNVARLARLSEGYPFFLSARSPARADWSEILRKTSNWIGLSATWEVLCKVPSTELPCWEDEWSSGLGDGVGGVVGKKEGKGKKEKERERERIHKEAVMEALGDERVVDDETFARVVEARERRALREMEHGVAGPPHAAAILPSPDAGVNGVPAVNGNSNGASAAVNGNGASATTNGTTNNEAIPTTTEPAKPAPKKPKANGTTSTVAKDEEYLIGTERADAIAKWILEAPDHVDTTVAGVGIVKKKKRRPPQGRVRKDDGELEGRMEGLDVA